MKKKIVLLILILSSLSMLSVFANVNAIAIVVDGNLVEFSDVEPFVNDDGRTMVPVRFVDQALGATVDWVDATQTVIITKADIRIEMVIGSKRYTVNGMVKEMDTTAEIYNERTIVPVRFSAEDLNSNVDWDDIKKQVIITSPTDEIKEEKAKERLENIDDYTFMVFMNGTDLESEYDEELGEYAGAGSSDLAEMTAIGSNDKINMIVETGGTLKWVNPNIDETQNQRWLIEKNKIKNIGNVGKKNMGEAQTLESFIVWTIENYPAKKYVLDLWNHGGGPIVGYGVDEYFEYDSLKLEELAVALQGAKEKTGVTFEVIGFDACLMGSIEVAKTVQPFAKYFIASEELEPGHGWNYTPILKGIIDKPEMDGIALGKIIANGFYDQAVTNDTVAETTLSVIDLSKVDNVSKALDNLTSQIIKESDDSEKTNGLFKVISNAKSFGGNTEEQGYTDIVDLGDFGNRLMVHYAEENEALQKAIKAAVVYKIAGSVHKSASGLSVYLPYKDKDFFAANVQVLNELDMTEEHKSFVKKYLEKLVDFQEVDIDSSEISVALNEEDNFELTLSETINKQLESVLINIYEVDLEKSLYRSYGYDSLVTYNETIDKFAEAFSGSWTLLDGKPISLQVVYEDETSTDYEIPVLLNGKRVNILATWFYDDTYETGGFYQINGARGMIDSQTNMPDKKVSVLKAGDKVEPIYDVLTLEDNSESEEIGELIILTSDSSLKYDMLKGSDFVLRFKIVDFAGGVYFSEYSDITFE